MDVRIERNEDAAASQDAAATGARANVDTAGSDAADTSAVSPEFKASMDSYEAFFNEYAEFMKQYQADPTSAELVAQYSDMLTQYAETMGTYGAIDASNLSTADYAYYAEVSARISAKLLEVA